MKPIYIVLTLSAVVALAFVTRQPDIDFNGINGTPRQTGRFFYFGLGPF